MGDCWREAEFEAIFYEHHGRILRVVRRVLRTDLEAEEVCADVFLRLYRSGPTTTAKGSIGGWLYRSATRAAIDVLRARRRKGETLEDDLALQAVDPGEGPLAQMLRQEQVGEVRAVLARLKIQKTQLLLLRHSGLSYREVADALQLDVHSVGSKLARAEAEFCKLYQRQQQLQLKTPQLQTAKERQ